MKTGGSLKNRQGGAVAAMVGISMVMLIGFLALVIDLGRLYLAKTGLQNAADAAALSGAKELNGSLTGISKAVEKAVETGELNSYFGNLGQQQVELGSGNDLTNAYIWFSSSPSGPWYHGSEVQSNPGDKYFIKVDTASGNLTTWFAPIFGLISGGSHSNTSTFGMAVAGYQLTDIAPIGVCALDANESNEYGFKRGMAYDIGNVNALKLGLTSGDPIWLHPTGAPDACVTSEGNASTIVPFLCAGKSLISGKPGSKVMSNTGFATGKALAAINTRFDIIDSEIKDLVSIAECPPDANIKEFVPPQATGSVCEPLYCNSFNNKSACNGEPLKLCQWGGGGPCTRKQPPDPAACSNAVDWIIPPPTQQAATLPWPVPPTSPTAADYGVLWSYSRPTDQTWANWNGTDYGGITLNPSVSPAIKCTLPIVGTVECLPYQYGINTKLDYYKAPDLTHGPKEGRRVIKIVIVSCPGTSGGICRTLDVLSVGRFFVQKQVSNSQRDLIGEFDGLDSGSPAATGDVILYR